ncbi:efflux RND transporter periplasmic adaptor subunit [Oceanibacterium hippocampi]|uniref:Multidrug resistance protein MdtA n=1 Tax=Oceanibacterium hippocampi TaxID=745714 RepID=A0A1Y5TZW0_9PROT|nr:efflux RND transporter periplasmic adaptor subunit [Oceanibacterium hippocampi]SLN72898.1 Multidrug resistance protein MdtA precursor [Oceanibacterium hippocampi]
MKVGYQIGILAVLAGAAWAGWEYRESLPFFQTETVPDRRGAPRAVQVDAATARAGTIALVAEAIGTARANESIVLTSKVTGKVVGFGFQEGQFVKKGTLLLELDATELEAEVEESRANLRYIEQGLKRAQQLLKTRNVPQARVDELLAEQRAGEAGVAADAARLADYRILAPFSGTIGLREVSIGALVRPGDTVTTLDDLSRIKIDFQVPERLLAHLRPGLGVAALSDAYEGRSFDGVVDIVDNRVDPVTRTVRVRATLDNKEGLLRPGMFMSIRMTLGAKENGVLVPEQAIVVSATGQRVFVIREGKAYRVPVELGQRSEGTVEILSGVAAGDVVVTGGVQKLRDGAPVEIRDAAGSSDRKGGSPPAAEG